MIGSKYKENFDELVNSLYLASVECQIPGNFVSERITIEDEDVVKLLSYSSILSLSENKSEISLSYEIITRLLEISKGQDSRITAGAEVILSRIGNFPGRELLRMRQGVDSSDNISPLLRLECLSRESENSLYQTYGKVILTDFQYKLYMALGEEHSLSFSAPTSAGKSFVLNLDLIRKIRDKEKQSVVYIVPTKALISEVSQRIRSILRSEQISDVTVRTAPFPIAKKDIKCAAVYVLTQERLMSFITNQDEKPFITSLIIDEAHEIKKGKRGIILQNAIEITLKKHAGVEVLFASPLIRNPVYFLSLFGRHSEGKYFVETVSPVSQNVILVSEVNRKPKQMGVSFLSNDKEILVGYAQVGFKLRGSKVQQKANLALSIASSSDGSIIVFSNGPADAEKVAEHITKGISDFEPSEEILSFVEFIKEDIHPEYSLSEFLLKGVAFHYGKMPSLVRSGVEKLLKSGELKFICCTSTLLQGVNLPAKHIIIENPKSGDNPMSRADFLNLAGRAGRLLHEFHGNIWCIRPFSWDEKCYKGDQLQEIFSSIDNNMIDGGSIVKNLLENSITDAKIKDEAEAVFGKLYHDYLDSPDLSQIEKYRTDENSDILDETIEELKKVNVTLPIEILENNKSLRPDHLQKIYEHLSDQLLLTEFIPMSPYITGAKERMEHIFQIIVQCFDWNLNERYMSWVSYLAYRWVWSVPIGTILAERVSYVQREDPAKKVSSIIRECLGVIEESIRFKLVKYFSAYIEILRLVLLERKLNEEISKVEPYHIYLEFGSCNRHALNLMALGLSRFSSLHIQKQFDLPDDSVAEDYLKKMKTMNIDRFDMPKLCKQEIKNLIS